jgi:hypothetical protein
MDMNYNPLMIGPMSVPPVVRLAVVAMLAPVAACSDSSPEARFRCADDISAPAVMTIAWNSRPDTMAVLVNDEATVQAACEYLATRSGAPFPSGPIVKGAGIDPDVPFHWIADSVRLAEAAIELCDGSMMKTAQEVDEYFLGATGSADSPTAPFCPWGARPVRVEKQ